MRILPSPPQGKEKDATQTPSLSLSSFTADGIHCRKYIRVCTHPQLLTTHSRPNP